MRAHIELLISGTRLAELLVGPRTDQHAYALVSIWENVI